ncbi:type II toxin-antitoxin system VapC family toxin [Rhodopila sp.]|uniref:type II toxin-antitoxin system VapC family toxin n=1 Tax=Rhodopila sp. TaxID=2480087 RepID=UPI003D13ABA6
MGALRLLLDTHAFYWWHTGDTALSTKARSAIADDQNEKYISAITAWEFVAKFQSGKELAFGHIAADVVGVVAAQGFTELAITMRHAQVAARLPFYHKDPMDRFLIAQATVEDMTIVTTDNIFGSYAVKLLW